MHHIASATIETQPAYLRIELQSGACIDIGEGWEYWHSAEAHLAGERPDAAEGWTFELVNADTAIMGVWTEEPGDNVWCDTVLLTSGHRIIFSDDGASVIAPRTSDDSPMATIIYPDEPTPAEAALSCPDCGNSNLDNMRWKQDVLDVRALGHDSNNNLTAYYQLDYGEGDNERFVCLKCCHEWPVPADLEVHHA